MSATQEAPGHAWTWFLGARVQVALRLGVVLSLSLLALLLTSRAARPPHPVGREAPPERLSAERASESLDLLLGTGPHPVASDRNRQVRDRILRELRRLGYAPQIQHTLSCRPGLCAEVDNIFVNVPGSHPDAGTLLLAAHYDSVPAAQGAADDGIGTASLIELARALKHRPQTKQDLLLLFTDGEEAGLLGMRAFVEHPAFHPVTYVINVEARGNRGPMLLFETATGDAPLVRAYAERATRPLTSSLFQSVYRRLPNDTDFSITLRAGRRGLNFACIGGVEHYHTSYDDLEHLDRGTLQHGLDHLDAALRGLDQIAGTEAASPVEAEPNYFDLLGGHVVFLPGWFGWLATLLGLLVPCSIAAWQRKHLHWRVLFGALGLSLLALAVSIGLNVGLGELLRKSGRTPALWVAHAGWIVLTGAGIGLICLLWQAGQRRPTEPTSLEQSVVVGLLFGLLSLTLLGVLPGAAYLAYLPTLGLALLSVGTAFVRVQEPSKDSRATAWLVWGGGSAVAFCAAIVWFPVLIQLYTALGLIALPAIGALWFLWGLIWLPLLPPQSRRLVPWLAALLLATTAVVLLQAPYTEDVPQRASVGVVYDATKKSGLVLVDASHGPVPPKLAEALGLEESVGPSFPWLGGWGDSSQSGPSNWQSPVRSGLRAVRREVFPDGVHYELDWRRQLWAEAVSLNVREGTRVELSYVLGGGEPRGALPRLVAGRDTSGVFQRWLVVGNPRQPLRVQLKVPNHVTELPVLVCEHRFELPDEWARKVASHRPSNAVASQFGDNTVICHEEIF